MNNIKEISRCNEDELRRGLFGGEPGSWHEQYRDSSYIFVGGLPYDLSEGDIICVFSEWGEIEDINVPRDESTGKSKGFAFIKYEDQRSTILAVDNCNGIQILRRTIRVDHVAHYKLPKHLKEKEHESAVETIGSDGQYGPPEGERDDNENIYKPGHAYKNTELANEFDISKGVDLYSAPESGAALTEDIASATTKRNRQERKAIKKARKEAKKAFKKEKKKIKKFPSGPHTPPSLALHNFSSRDDEDDSWRGRIGRNHP